MRSGVLAGADGAVGCAVWARGSKSSSVISSPVEPVSKITLENEQNMIRRTDHVLR
jgi:hypothetical protein